MAANLATGQVLPHPPDTIQMKEVIITHRSAFLQKHDTLVYVVDSFKRDENETAEDALKRMGGVSVSGTGKITVLGKPVNTIYINGAPVEITDIRNISQNLPATFIDRIEFADVRGEMDKVSGLNTPALEKSINIVIKNEFSKGLLGRAKAGYGTGRTYCLKNFASYMASGLQLMATVDASNTGGGDGNNDEQFSMPNGIPRGSTRPRAFDISYNYQKSGSPIRLNGAYSLLDITSSLQQHAVSQTFVGLDSIISKHSFSNEINKMRSHRFTTQLEYMPRDDFSFRASIDLIEDTRKGNKTLLDTTVESTTSGVGLVQNQDALATNKSPGLIFSGTITKYSRDKKRSIVLNYSYNSSSDISAETMNYLKDSGLVASYATDFKRTSTQHSTGLQFAESLSDRSKLLLNETIDIRSDISNKDISLSSASPIGLPDSAQVISTIQNRTENRAHLRYTYNSKRFAATIGLKSKVIYIVHKDESGELGNNSTTMVAWFPTTTLSYQMPGGNQLDLSVDGDANAPSPILTNTLTDYHDSMNIFTGNPNLKAEKTDIISLRYQLLGHNNKRGMIWAELRYSWTRDKITYCSDVHYNKNYIMPVNMNGSNRLYLSLNHNKTLNARLNVVSTISLTYDHSPYRLNEHPGTNLQTGTAASVKLLYSSTRLDAEVRANHLFTRGTANEHTNQYQVTGTSAQFTLSLPLAIKLTASGTYFLNWGNSEVPDSYQLFIDMVATKEIKAVPGLSIQAFAKNISNRHSATDFFITGNLVQQTSYNTTGSYLLFSIIYRYNAFKSSDRPQ